MKGTPTAYSLHHLESISWNAGRCWKSLSVRVIKYLPCCHNIQIYSNLPRSCHITSGCFDTFQLSALTPTLWPGDKIVVHHLHLLEHSGLPTNSMPWDHLTSPLVVTCSAEVLEQCLETKNGKNTGHYNMKSNVRGRYDKEKSKEN